MATSGSPRELTVPSDATQSAAPQRTDLWLAEQLELPRAQIKKLIDAGSVTLDGLPLSNAARRIRAGMRFEVELPAPPASEELQPEDIPLDILFEDESVIVLGKPAGMVVHPAAGHAGGTLANALLHLHPELPCLLGKDRPGIVHRLDRETSGLMVVGKTEAASASLISQFKAQSVKKIYIALVHGIAQPPQGRIETLLGRSPRDRKRRAVLESDGRNAVTHYRTVEVYAALDVSKLEVRIETGRTHQIRVHMRHIGLPILGDPVYGSPRRDRALGIARRRQLLHAAELAFDHPTTGERLHFVSPLPPEFTLAYPNQS